MDGAAGVAQKQHKDQHKKGRQGIEQHGQSTGKWREVRHAGDQRLCFFALQYSRALHLSCIFLTLYRQPATWPASVVLAACCRHKALPGTLPGGHTARCRSLVHVHERRCLRFEGQCLSTHSGSVLYVPFSVRLGTHSAQSSGLTLAVQIDVVLDSLSDTLALRGICSVAGSFAGGVPAVAAVRAVPNAGYGQRTCMSLGTCPCTEWRGALLDKSGCCAL